MCESNYSRKHQPTYIHSFMHIHTPMGGLPRLLLENYCKILIRSAGTSTAHLGKRKLGYRQCATSVTPLTQLTCHMVSYTIYIHFVYHTTSSSISMQTICGVLPLAEAASNSVHVHRT